MPAWKATAFSTAEVIGSDTRTTTGSGGRLRGLLVMGEVAMAVFLLVWCGAAAANAPRRRSVRSRVSCRERPLDARRSAGLEVSDRGSLAAVLRPGRRRDCRRSRRGRRRLGERSAAGLLRRRRRLLRDRRRPSARRPGAAEHGLSGREPDVLLDPRSADPGRTRLRSPRHARRRAGVHRERGIRAHVWRPLTDRPARGVAADVVAGSHAVRARDRRRRAPGEGTAG